MWRGRTAAHLRTLIPLRILVTSTDEEEEGGKKSVAADNADVMTSALASHHTEIIPHAESAV